ncbi:PdaC/SigV domain-containing protein [Paenibacillus caui]|uniref:PdaC/SigV domain-containing protein n=1 Tax=Paenibacillus caui TaxID=2873927 RepID=UPI001CA96437|nr:DUF4163 domain-containing protein [Paenibacillus caui]
MHTYKKWTTALLAASLLLGTAAGSAQAEASALATAKTSANKAVHLTVNGKALPQKGSMGRGGVLVPLAFIRDGLGLKVSYDAKSKSYSIVRGNVIVQLKPTEYQTVQAVVNGSTPFSDYEWKSQDGLGSVSVHVLIDHLGYSVQWNNAAKTLDLVPQKLNDVKITAQKLGKSDQYTTVSIQYPELSGLADTGVQDRVNQMFKNRAAAYAEDSLKRSAELGLGPMGAKNEFAGSYTVEYNRNGVVSFRMLNYEYTGGAHGMSYLEGITLRLSDGKQLQLSDLLKDSPEYKSVIDAKVAARLKQDPGYLGGFETIGDKPGFYIKDEGIVIFFQLYEYLPYAAGFPEYYIPFSALLAEGSDPFAG